MCDGVHAHWETTLVVRLGLWRPSSQNQKKYAFFGGIWDARPKSALLPRAPRGVRAVCRPCADGMPAVCGRRDDRVCCRACLRFADCLLTVC